MASSVKIATGGPSRPRSATSAPAAPPKREPNTTEKLTTFGPGRNCATEKASLNSCAVIHCFCSTSIRRAQGKTPPKPETETVAKATNNSGSVGRPGEDKAASGGSDM